MSDIRIRTFGVETNLSHLGGGEEAGDVVRGVKQDMEGWKEVLIPIAAVLRWERPYHPVILLGMTTILFALIWLCQVSALTTISVIAMVLGLLDFGVPYFGPSLTRHKSWTEEDNVIFTLICVNIAQFKNEVSSFWDGLFIMRQHNSTMFFIFSMVSLLFTAWIGNLVNNLLLTYVIVSFCLCLPGLQRNTRIQDFLLRFVNTVNKIKSYLMKKPKQP